MKKVLILDVDKSVDQFANFKKYVSEDLAVNLVEVNNPVVESDHDYLFKKFSNAGFNLEYFLLGNQFYSANRDYEHVLLAWGNYSTENIAMVKSFLHDTYNKRLIVFSHNSIIHDQSWVFGNISAVVKWLSGLFKLNEGMFAPPGHRDGYMMEGTKFNIAIWFAIRIGLNVYGFDKEEN